MAQYQMQARSSSDGQLYTWTSSPADWAATGFPGPGSAEHVVVSAQKPDPGGGSGDVGGPGVSGAGNLPTFSNTSGKVLGDSGISLDGVIAHVFHAALYGCRAAATAAANVAAINAATAAAHAAGGGRVQLPRGVIQLATAGENVALSLRDKHNVWLCGAGVGLTELYLANGADSHVINIDGTAKNIVVSDMTINGNRANQGAGFHCIRIAEVDGAWLDRLHLKEASHYAVGLQSQTKRFMFLTNLKCENTGGDAIDTKNTDDDNAHNVMSNVTVLNFGLSTANQAGIDLRGPWQVSNVTVEWSVAAVNAAGIRFRSGELLDSNGYGAHHSNLSNFSCTTTSGTGTGVAIDARDVKLSNGHCVGMASGYYWTDNASGGRATNCTAEDVTAKGFDTDPLADGVKLTSCFTDGTAAEGFYLEGPNAKLVACEAKAAGTVGVRTVSTATGFEAHAVDVIGAVGVGLQLEGANARVFGGSATACNQGMTLSGATPRVFGFHSTGSTAGDGLVLALGSDDGLISGCAIAGNADEGVNVRSDRCRLIGNDITGNVSWGIQIDAGAAGTLLDANRLSGNSGALTDAGSGTKYGLLNDGLGTPTIGAHSALVAEVVTGYITIRDDAGVTRKIAVVS